MAFRSSFLNQTAADYHSMFKDVAQLPAFKGMVDEGINWAKQHLKRQDRITWYLRYFRLHVYERVVTTLDREQDRLHGFLLPGEPNAQGTTYDFDHVKPDDATPEKLNQLEVLLKQYHEKLAEASNLLKTRAMKDDPLPNQVEREFWSYYSENNLKSLQRELDHFLSLDVPGIQNYVFGWQSRGRVMSELGHMEEEWKREANGKLLPKEGDELLIPFQDGYGWWKLSRGYCKEEGDAMGHCGNVNGQYNSDERILSLRRAVEYKGQQHWEPHLTFILDGEGMLGEMKGRGNQKPAAKYHPYIIELLKHTDIVKGIKGGGYLPQNNFAFTDLPEKTQEELVALNPGLMSCERYVRTRGIDEYIIRKILKTFDMSEEISVAKLRFNDDGTPRTTAHYHDLPTYNVRSGGGNGHFMETRMKRYDPVSQSLILRVWRDIDEFTDEYGDETGQWCLAVLRGKRYLSDELDNAWWVKSADMVRAINDHTQTLLYKYILKQHRAEVKAWEKRTQEKFTDEEDSLVSIITEDLPAIESQIGDAYQVATEAGTINQIRSWFISAFKEDMTGPNDARHLQFYSSSNSETPDFFSATLMEIWPIDEAATAADESQGRSFEDTIGYDDNWNFHVNAPSYGFNDFDDKTFQKAVLEILPEPKKPRKRVTKAK